VRDFVLISSDKAVRPTNVMGATKRWAELIMWQKSRQALEAGKGQKFSVVRFGNVLGSNGSVVPLFKEQIARGGPITLTDERMTRYFMSIHEAAELIVQAGALSQGGDVFVLEMGSPILIKNLAENMIRLAGLSVRNAEDPDGDIEIVTSGIRPGEKMTEELFYNTARVQPTPQAKIMRAPHDSAAVADIEGAVARMTELLAAQDEQGARTLLFDLIKANPVS
jgi:FlaA1/EpsC-like NDP-sugar epimerase